MRIVGIDPGSIRCGWSLIDTDARRVMDCGVIEPDKGLDYHQRLIYIYWGIYAILRGREPDAMGIEDQYLGMNPKTMGMLKEVSGAIKGIAIYYDIPFKSFAATTVKKAATKSGKSKKKQVARAMMAEYNMTNEPPEDAADAIAVAHTYWLDTLASEVVALQENDQDA